MKESDAVKAPTGAEAFIDGNGGGGGEDEGGRSAGRGARKIYSRPAIGLWAAGELAPKASLACSFRCRSQLGEPRKSAPPTWSKFHRAKARRPHGGEVPSIFIRLHQAAPRSGEATLMESARARKSRSSADAPRHRILPRLAA